ncbi:hypothetical protein Csa_023640, partial [Cucumis sativus]
GCSDSRSFGLWVTNPITKTGWVYGSGLLEYLLSVHTAAEGAFSSGPRVRVLVVAAEINRRLPRLWYAEARRNVGECVKAWVYVAVKLIMVLSVGG